MTTSLTDGRERWIGHGPAIEAILASSAIPSIFPAVTIDGDVLVDGGVVNNVPISRAMAAGCDRIYVLLCGPLHYHPRPPRRPAEAALTAFFVAIHARFVRELAALPPGIEVVVFSGGGDPSGQYRDFSATAALIEEGRAEVPRRARPLRRDVPGSGPASGQPAASARRTRAGGPPSPPDLLPAVIARTGGPVSPAGATPADGYLLSNDAPEAMDRFEAFAPLFDPSTFRHLDGLGLAPGWRVWEVGAGGTSVLDHLAARVGPDRARAGHRPQRVVGGRAGRQPTSRCGVHDVAARPAPGRSLRPGARPPGPRPRARARPRPGHTWSPPCAPAASCWSRTPIPPSSR